MLRITKQTDYGIVMMTVLAAHRAHSVHSARGPASTLNLPLPTVGKILKALARAGLLVSHRGVKGGYSLARASEAISVGQIIEALDGPIAITECCEAETCECDIEISCPVRVNWQRINHSVRNALVAIPLSDMTTAISFQKVGI